MTDNKSAQSTVSIFRDGKNDCTPENFNKWLLQVLEAVQQKSS